VSNTRAGTPARLEEALDVRASANGWQRMGQDVPSWDGMSRNTINAPIGTKQWRKLWYSPPGEHRRRPYCQTRHYPAMASGPGGGSGIVCWGVSVAHKEDFATVFKSNEIRPAM